MPSLQEKLKKTAKKVTQKGSQKLRAKLGLPPAFEELVGYQEGSTLEEDVQAETSAILTGFKARAKQEAERFQQATDTRFYCTLVFQTEAQKDAFLKAMDWYKFGDLFLDGLQVAKAQGVSLTPVTLRNRDAVGKTDKKLAPLVMEEDE